MLTNVVNAETYTGAILLTRRAEVSRLIHKVAVSRYDAAMSKPRPAVGYIAPSAPAPLIRTEKSVIVKERFQTTEVPLAKDAKPAKIRAAKSPKPVPEPEVAADAVWVKHAKFGTGLIISQGDGKVTVSFGGEVRTLLVKLANLENVAV